MTEYRTAAEMIAQCIAYETAEFEAAAADEKHYWSEWSAEDMQAGTPVVQVVSTSPGLGRETRITFNLMIRGASGKHGSVQDVVMEKHSTGKIARYNGVEGWCRRRAAKLFGPAVEVQYKRYV